MNIVFGIDRDGTLIRDNNFFGKNANWEKEIEFNQEVINFFLHIKTKYNMTKIVITNQSGVARGLFTRKRVEEIHTFINDYLNKNKIRIDNWQYCPDVDTTFAKGHPEIIFLPKYIKDRTKRKPAPDMFFNGLKELKLRLTDFDVVVILGDRSEDEQLAKNVQGKYLNVRNKSYQDLLREFKGIIS